MLTLVRKKKFIKGYEKIKHKKRVLEELKIVIQLLLTKQEIPKKYRDHELKGKLAGIRELHLGFDDLLLYVVLDSENKLVLLDIGTHAKTLKK